MKDYANLEVYVKTLDARFKPMIVKLKESYTDEQIVVFAEYWDWRESAEKGDWFANEDDSKDFGYLFDNEVAFTVDTVERLMKEALANGLI